MRRPGSRSRMGWLLAVIVAVVAACSGDGVSETFSEVGSSLDGDSGATVTTVAAASEGAPEEEARDETSGGGSDELGSGAITPVALPSDLGRDIIFTADLRVAVADVASAGEQAAQEIQSLGGFLFGQRTTGSPEPSSVLTFKIQPEDFQEALARLGMIGEVRSQEISADDVTERIVDLESRIATAASSVDRLRALLAEATDIEAIVELESELLARETELETLRGSLRTLQEQVALATIVLTLTEAASRPEIEVAMSAYPGFDEGASCPGEPQLTVEEDSETTVCIEVTNVGDTSLVGFELRDPVLDVDLDDAIVVFGDPDVAMEPGETLILALEVVADRDLRTRTTVTASPADEDGDPITAAKDISSTVTFFVDSVDPDGIASFGEGLGASWDLLVDLWRVLLLVAGALIPFVWVPVVGWFAWRAWRVRRPVPEQS